MREIIRSAQFKHDVKLAEKRGKDMTKLRDLILLLVGERRYQHSTKTILSAASGSITATAISNQTGCCSIRSTATIFI
jgi:hypothetical protein